MRTWLTRLSDIGAAASYEASFGGTARYAMQFVRDDLGRIAKKLSPERSTPLSCTKCDERICERHRKIYEILKPPGEPPWPGGGHRGCPPQSCTP